MYFSQQLDASRDFTASATRAATNFSLLDLTTSSVRCHENKLQKFRREVSYISFTSSLQLPNWGLSTIYIYQWVMFSNLFVLL